MGYDLHITRKSEWLDESGPEFSLAEWKAYVSGDDQFTLDGFAEARSSEGAVLRMESEGLAFGAPTPVMSLKETRRGASTH